MAKKQHKKYDKPMELKPEVEWSDLIALSLQPEKPAPPKKKPTKKKKGA